MTALAIIAVALAVMVLVVGAIITWGWNRAERAEADRVKAEQEAHYAEVQERYAEIATAGRSVDDTAGVLDEGRFFLPTDQALHGGGTESRSRRDPRGAKPDAE